MASFSDRVTLSVGLAQGGITHYGYSLAEALTETGLRARVLLYSHPEYDLAGYPHHHRVERSLELATDRRTRVTSPFKNFAALVAAAARDRLVHFQWTLGPRNDRLIWPALERLRTPIVYTAHDVVPHEPEIMTEAHARWIYERAAALFVHGEHLKALMLERFGVPSERVHVIPHGNYNFFADAPSAWTRAKARASFGFRDDERVVLFFGLLRAYKGIDVLIEACRIASASPLPDGRRLRLLIAGRPFRNHWTEGGYAEQIRDARLEAAVSLALEHIAVPDIARFFRAADVVAVPYKRGSQSGVLQLAHSFAKPAVASRVGSLTEGSRPEFTRFVEPENAEELAVALRELAADPALGEQLGMRAREFVERELDWRRIAQRTRDVYRSVR